MLQNFTVTASSRNLRIREEAEDRPTARRKVIAACVVAALAIHGALAIVPLNFGGRAAQYGIAPGNQVEVTLMVESDEPAAAIEQLLAGEPPPPLDTPQPPQDLEPAVADEPIAAAPVVSPPSRTSAPTRSSAAPPSDVPQVAVRRAGAGGRTLAKPNYLRNPPPKYPAESRKLREEGVVLLKVAVTAEGRPASVQLQRSSGFARLDQAALNAVRRWEFNPAREGLTPVACAVEVPVRFGLN